MRLVVDDDDDNPSGLVLRPGKSPPVYGVDNEHHGVSMLLKNKKNFEPAADVLSSVM